MAECDTVLQKHLNSTNTIIHIMKEETQILSNMAGCKSAIQTLQHLLLENHIRTQDTGHNSDIHNTTLNTMLQQQKTVLSKFQYQLLQIQTSEHAPIPPTLIHTPPPTPTSYSSLPHTIPALSIHCLCSFLPHHPPDSPGVHYSAMRTAASTPTRSSTSSSSSQSPCPQTHPSGCVPAAASTCTQSCPNTPSSRCLTQRAAATKTPT